MSSCWNLMMFPCQSKQSSSAAIITREIVRVRANCDSEAGTAKRRMRDFNVGFLTQLRAIFGPQLQTLTAP